MTIEQGLLGLIGYSFLVISAGWALVRAYQTRSSPRWLVGAIAASLLGMLVHGLFDGGPYVSRLSPLIFLPLGFAWGAAPSAPPLRTLAPPQLAWRSLAVLSPLVTALLLLALPGARGAMQANLGAVDQSARELSLYEWPTWGIQDQLRRSPAVDLSGAIARYTATLALDPDNVTAYRRLGQIALSRGDITAAQEYLTEAYERAPQERATRLMLGEVLALQGQPEQAAELWRTVDTAEGELKAREWWIGQVGTPQQQAAFAAAQAIR
jgi:tetratricopeptide (TPR) repeat protein